LARDFKKADILSQKKKKSHKVNPFKSWKDINACLRLYILKEMTNYETVCFSLHLTKAGLECNSFLILGMNKE
jgi:fumarate reductase subunit C